ncbi:WxL domain-containing protein [Listeria rustica]|uniref:WxL domain-containing protein n=1 Tax=Listeria rustica TaxID=2713503 RepID=A0A7W1YFG2_9LIST|nr:WxL domain-containing protein [Listeria rustica]MBA3925591.1 WxL domain-containing protein [Listeria rustica]
MKLGKKTILAVVTLSTAFTTAFAIPSNAAEVGSLNSNSTVQFEVQDGSVTNPPVNPLDPNKPVDPGTTDPGTSGPLSIDYVSSFDFGTQVISGETQTYNAKLDSMTVDGTATDVPNNVQVTDNRGSNSGWELTVAQNGQLQDGTARALEGAEVKINNATAVTRSDSTITAPTVASSITLNPDGTSAMVMNAEADQGMGHWVDNFGADNTEAADAVTLTVPGATAKYADSAYETTLTWTLSDTPA